MPPKECKAVSAGQLSEYIARRSPNYNLSKETNKQKMHQSVNFLLEYLQTKADFYLLRDNSAIFVLNTSDKKF